MELENINVGNGLELATFDNPVLNECFLELTRTIKNCYQQMGINSKTMHLEYQRYSDAKSVLAIKLTDGKNDDKENYMFVGSSANKHSNKIYCDVFMHADAKSAMRATQMSNMISRKIVNFFEKTEETLDKNGMSDLEFSVNIPLSDEQEKKDQQEKENGIKKFIKRFRQK